MSVERKQDPDTYEKHDGWQKQMAKKAEGQESERHNGRLFCVAHRCGRLAHWTSYRRAHAVTDFSSAHA